MDSNKNNDRESSGIFNYIEQEKSHSTRSTRVPHALAIGASMVIILAGIQAASGLLGPMLLALFLAIILLVPLRWLQKHRCPQFLAFLIVMVCTVAMFVGIIYFVGKSLNNFIGEIPAYKDRVVEKYNEVEEWLKKKGFQFGNGEKQPPKQPEPQEPDETEPIAPEPIAPAPVPVPPPPPPVAPIPEKQTTDKTTDSEDEGDFLETDGAPEPQDAEPASGDNTEIHPLSPEEKKNFLKQAKEMEELPSLIALDPQTVALWIAKAMQYVQKMIEGGFLVLLFTIFMLIEASCFPGKVHRAFGDEGPINIKHFHRIADDVRRYLFLKTLSSLMSAIAAMFVYKMFGIDSWIFWGIVAFFMYFIPNIGGTLAAVIPGILILAMHGVPGVLLYAVCLVALECTIAYGIEPKMLGHGLQLSTLVIILSLFFWGFLLGIIGLFLAAPLTVMIKIILQAFPETRWLAVFLEGRSAEKH
jgi:predicted PurR-regulated permease PerM